QVNDTRRISVLAAYYVTHCTPTLSFSNFFFYGYADHRDLHSFPTRRSSDLSAGCRAAMRHPARRRSSSCSTRTTAARHGRRRRRSEEHTSELQSRGHLVCRLLLEKKKQTLSRAPPT